MSYNISVNPLISSVYLRASVITSLFPNADSRNAIKSVPVSGYVVCLSFIMSSIFLWSIIFSVVLFWDFDVFFRFFGGCVVRRVSFFISF
ncbi:hypothetical protein HHI36_009602 [Cryptolaemus montrouzieri]|uniref:Uncharacterized protein n=1 Tax=Cryptolaemus montrouzieri TaxID=559131 RepID=A0ABD2MG90_9CUCU